jgi:acetyl esterase/lipase
MMAITPRSKLMKRMRFEKVDVAGVPAEWFHPPGVAGDAVLLYLHGGGYTLGSIESHRELVSQLAVAVDAKALAIDYRLAPESRFPAQVHDALGSYRWLLERGTLPSRVVIAGESAGGGLTMATLVSLRDAGEPLPAAAVAISPWVDLASDSASVHANARYDYVSHETLRAMARNYVDDTDLRNPLASPLYADLRGLPPLLVQAGGAEALLDDSRRLYDRAREAGVDVTLEIEEDMIHVWHMLGSLHPSARGAIARIGEFARRHLSPRGS